jgi:hypothetical protein
MNEARIDRLLAAALHQAIGDVISSRLEFYESYLRPRGWREDAVNLAPVAAVLSFLRHEPSGTYDAVMTRAAEYAAAWVHEAQPWHERLRQRLSPRRFRVRRVAQLARWQIARGYRGTRVAVGVRRGVLSLEIHGSIFCSTRDQGSAPHCRYYQAFVNQLLQRHGLPPAASRIEACRAAGGEACRMRFDVAAAPAVEPRPSSLRQHDVL